MNPARILPLLALSVSLGLPALRAQAPAGDQISFSYSHTADNDLSRGSAGVGDLGVDATRLTWRSGLPLSQATRATYGLTWNRFGFDRPAALAVPDTLQEIALDLGLSHRLNAQWLLIASVSPGLYGDLEGSSGDAFNAPALLLASYAQNPSLAWTFGLRVDAFSERAVLPFVGVNWKFAPDWEFTLGVPRAGISYQVSPALKLGLGVTAQGGNFHVARDPRQVAIAAGPRLADTKLDYHEIRVGLAADYKLSDLFSVSVEAGMVTDQKFDYYDRGYTLDGDAVAFFTLGLSARF